MSRQYADAENHVTVYAGPDGARWIDVWSKGYLLARAPLGYARLAEIHFGGCVLCGPRGAHAAGCILSRAFADVGGTV